MGRSIRKRDAPRTFRTRGAAADGNSGLDRRPVVDQSIDLDESGRRSVVPREIGVPFLQHRGDHPPRLRIFGHERRPILMRGRDIDRLFDKHTGRLELGNRTH